MSKHPQGFSNSSKSTPGTSTLIDVQPTNDQDILITDPDLVAQLENLKGMPKVRIAMEKRLQKTQLERNLAREERQHLTPIVARRQVAKERRQLEELQDNDIHHVHSILALCALPYKPIAKSQREYIKEYGRMSLVVKAGYLMDPYTGKMAEQGIPFGPKARLLELHICTRALRQKNPKVELEGSLSAFIRSLGFEVTGGEKGTLKLFKEQLNRLAACSMQIGLWNGSQARTINTQPIKSFDVWLPEHPDQQMLWNSSIVLSQEFYDSLQEHALPIDIRALSAVSHSAKQIDMLLWLAYRLKSLNRRYLIRWDKLQEQFGASIARPRKFRESFAQDLKELGEIFEKQLPVSISETGLTLFPCNPADYFIPPKPKLL